MRLTNWTDYPLRVLMYCAASQGRDQPVTISEIAQAHGISRSHLTKIVMQLSAKGLLETTRGRGGGLRLLKPAADIVLGDVVRDTESDFFVVECFDRETNTCRLSTHCVLKGVLFDAVQAFFAVLDRVTLEDLMKSPVNLLPLPQRAAPMRPGLPGLPILPEVVVVHRGVPPARQD